MTRVLLFVQTGDGPWKCIIRRWPGFTLDPRFPLVSLSRREEIMVNDADRFKWVECENAVAGRLVIAGVDFECPSCRGQARYESHEPGAEGVWACSDCNGSGGYPYGRILASGGKP